MSKKVTTRVPKNEKRWTVEQEELRRHGITSVSQLIQFVMRDAARLREIFIEKHGEAFSDRPERKKPSKKTMAYLEQLPDPFTLYEAIALIPSTANRLRALLESEHIECTGKVRDLETGRLVATFRKRSV